MRAPGAVGWGGAVWDGGEEVTAKLKAGRCMGVSELKGLMLLVLTNQPTEAHERTHAFFPSWLGIRIVGNTHCGHAYFLHYGEDVTGVGICPNSS